jgi:hypothetical protein
MHSARHPNTGRVNRKGGPMKKVVPFLVVAVMVGLVASVAMAAPTYVGADKCKMCHKIQYDSWVAIGKHNKALENAKASKDPAFAPACLGCHSTNKSETAMGVECEACHGAGSDYKALSVMKDKAKAIAAGLVMPTQATCEACHDGKEHHKKVDMKVAKVHEHKAAAAK